MPKTLLAVDDSLTMRKVLEITFSGEDFRVVTAEGQQDALSKLSEEPKVCVIDTALGNDDGYALCKEIRKRDPSATIILMSSRHNQYDQARGKDAGADDYMDKPFDTQQMIDKVRKAIVAREGSAGAPVAVPAAASPAAPKQPPMAARGAVPPIEQRGTQPSLGGAATSSRSRAATLMFGHEPSTGDLKVVGPVATTEAHAPPPRQPTPAPQMADANHPPPATVAATPAALHAINGQLAGKLEGMGLTPQQADAVLALTRDVVEKAVWEAVPVIAEALIKEEIARLTKGA